jgi:hypothetical protein
MYWQTLNIAIDMWLLVIVLDIYNIPINWSDICGDPILVAVCHNMPII